MQYISSISSACKKNDQLFTRHLNFNRYNKSMPSDETQYQLVIFHNNINSHISLIKKETNIMDLLLMPICHLPIDIYQ